MSKRNVLEYLQKEIMTNQHYNSEEIAKLMWENSGEVAGFYIKEGYRNRKLLVDFSVIMFTDRVSEGVLMVTESNRDYKGEGTFYGFPIEFGAFLAEMVENFRQLHRKGELPFISEKELLKGLERYRMAIMNILTPRIEEFALQVNESPIAATELLSIIPTPNIIYNDRVLGPFVSKVISRLIRLSTTLIDIDGTKQPIYIPLDVKEVRDIFIFLFGEDIEVDVARAILLNHTSVGILNDGDGKCMLVDYAASTINSLPKEELKEELGVLVDYKRLRAMGRELRMDLIDLSKNKRIAKRVIKMSKEDAYKVVFEDLLNNQQKEK